MYQVLKEDIFQGPDHGGSLQRDIEERRKAKILERIRATLLHRQLETGILVTRGVADEGLSESPSAEKTHGA